MGKATTKASAPAQALAVPTKDAPILIDLQTTAASMKVMADGYVIDSREMYDIATETLAQIRAAEKRCEEEKDKISKPLHRAWTAANALFKPIADGLGEAKKQLGRKMIAFEDLERARVRAEEQLALQRQAKEREAAEAALAEAQAAALESGDTSQLADAMVNVMVAETAMPMAGVAEKLDRGGHARAKKWIAEVEDVPAFLSFLARSLSSGDTRFNNTVDFKLGQLQQYAADTQGAAVPGVKFTCEDRLTARA